MDFSSSWTFFMRFYETGPLCLQMQVLESRLKVTPLPQTGSDNDHAQQVKADSMWSNVWAVFCHGANDPFPLHVQRPRARGAIPQWMDALEEAQTNARDNNEMATRRRMEFFKDFYFIFRFRSLDYVTVWLHVGFFYNLFRFATLPSDCT